MEQNPYQSPVHIAPEKPGPPGPGAMQEGMLNQVRVVSILMIVQGVLCLIMGGIMLFAMFIIVPQFKENLRRQPGGPAFPVEEFQTFMYAIYGSMAAAGILPGGLLILAGAFNFFFRGRILGITALILGLASMGTIYCLPTAIGLAIYGLIVYFHPSVKQGFALVAQGWTLDQVFARASQGSYGGPGRM